MNKAEIKFRSAIRAGDCETLTKLLTGGFLRKPIPIDLKAEQGLVVAFDIFDAKKPDMLQWLIEHGLDKDCKDSTGYNLLDMTILHKWGDQLRYLLGIGVKLQGVYNYDSSFWDERVFDLGEDLLVDLLKAGVPCSKNPKSKTTPLCKAIGYKFSRLAIEMMKAGADVNEANLDGDTPLHLAAKEGNVAIIGELISRGASINAYNHRARTPLYITMEYHMEGAALALIEAKCDVNAKCENNETALHVACSWSNERVVERLIASGADVNAMRTYSGTPFHFAAHNDESEGSVILKMLVAAGANTTLKTYQGETAIQIAERWFNKAGAEYLRQLH